MIRAMTKISKKKSQNSGDLKIAPDYKSEALNQQVPENSLKFMKYCSHLRKMMRAKTKL